MLEVLEDSNLFVVSLDDERQWYRYHQLFVEVLRNHLRRTEPTLIPILHRRASLVEHIGMSVGYQGQVHMVLRWLNALPDALVLPFVFTMRLP